MAGAEQALEAAFYLYPCLLTLTLLGVQCLQFYLHRRRVSRPGASESKPVEGHERIRNIFAWIIWTLQIVLSAVLLASIILVVQDAVSGRNEVASRIEFPLSAYSVCV